MTLMDVVKIGVYTILGLCILYVFVRAITYNQELDDIERIENIEDRDNAR